MKELVRKTFSNGWVVGTGTALLGTLLLRPIDNVLGTDLLGKLGTAIARLGSSVSMPAWLLLGLVLAVAMLLLLSARRRIAESRRRTLRVVSRDNANWWATGKSDGKPAMQLHGQLTVTNVADDDISVIRAHTIRPRTEGMVMVQEPNGNKFGFNAIPARGMSEVMVDFFVVPVSKKEGETLTMDVELVDQFGTSHRVKRVAFHSRAPKVVPEIAREAIHSLQDPIEKEIAAVLKAEAARYATCGRSVGGLGSIEVTYQGRTTAGVGADWREVGAAKNQSIVLEPEKAVIASDNGDALVAFYARLKTKEEQERFTSALLTRLAKGTEYSDVAYLILYVLFRTRSLIRALGAAKRQLRDDTAISFSNFIWMLDGFLKYQHSAFVAIELDEIEKFMEGLQGERFRVVERLNAVRAFRLGKGQSS